jgi:RNA polymerase sigma factor (sigma-70 family)
MYEQPQGHIGRQEDGPPSARALPPRAERERMLGLVMEMAGQRASRWLEPDDAADLAQDVGLSFWKTWESEPARFETESLPEEWISAAVRNAVINRYEAEQTRAFAGVPTDPSRDEAVESNDDPAAEAEAFELGRHLAEALNALSVRQRQVFFRVHDRGETYAEAAEALNLSRETVKAYLARATQIMRAALARYEGSVDNE